jgi:outer membrane protein assembly factor BamB
MATAHSDKSNPRSLRQWPGVIVVALVLLTALVVPLVVPGGGIFAVLGGVAGGLLILLWWLFFSRAPWMERLGAIAVMVGAVLATSFVVHQSVSNGMQGMMLYVFSIPLLSIALVAAVVVSRGGSDTFRRGSIVAAVLLACGLATTIRTGGVSGDGVSDLHWRWTPTPEDRLLAQAANDPPLPAPPTEPRAPVAAAAPVAPAAPAVPVAPVAPAAPAAPAAPVAPAAPAVPVAPPAPVAPVAPAAPAAPAALDSRPPHAPEWPGFRGPHRDSVVSGVLIDTDWSHSPPTELWRKPIGPGWSSFAVDGDLAYTQEQRGEDEMVSCYRVSTGEPVWRHRDPVRFYESNGGPGPRATPTLHNGRVYTMGATGVVNALDAATGARLWSKNAAADTGKTVPDWGVASSPLVIDDLVVVAVAGQLAAYDARTGDQKWVGKPGGTGYSSPHLATIAGVPQVLLLRGSRTISVSPADGTLLWEHASGPPSTSIVQPAVTGSDTVLIATGDAMGGNGILRVAVEHGPAGWSVEERWTSRGLKPYFNDFVVHEGHVYGFDGSILSCIDLADGARKWKGGRYGHGQLVVLPDQDVLLVLSEDGELALVSATPEKFTEVARLPALEGKTWNHPVVVGDVLLVRNGEEMAAFRIPHLAR